MTATQPKALIDADILIKLSALDLVADCLKSLGLTLDDCATMQSMRFSAGLNNLQVRERKAGKGAPAQRLLKTLQAITGINSLTQPETELSAELVSHSLRLGLAVDAGEAIVISVCILRGIPYVTTGDKKAIRSLPQLEAVVKDVAAIKGRVVPLEYLLLQVIAACGYKQVLPKLLAGQHCDTGLKNALTAAAAGANQGVFINRISSKLQSLHGEAPGYVIP